MFIINQVAAGKVAGTFVILGFRAIGGEQYAQVKPINPKDHTQVGKGEMSLPLDTIKAI